MQKTKVVDKTGETKYSYGPSNNTNEGFIHRIRNIFKSDENPSMNPHGKEWRYRRQLTTMIEKALDVKINPGNVDGSVFPSDGFGKGYVIFKEENKILRSKNAYDFENILPITGAIVAERLGIVKKWTDATAEQRNYIANWLAIGAPNDTSDFAKVFAKKMQDNQILATRLEDLQDKFLEWSDLKYDEKMKHVDSFDNQKKLHGTL